MSRLQGSLLRSAWLLSAVCDSHEQTAKLGSNPVQDSISKGTYLVQTNWILNVVNVYGTFRKMSSLGNQTKVQYR